MIHYNKTTLPNGLRLVTESHAQNRAVSLGIWVETGTRHETKSLMGATHFVEHLVFKGTKQRSAYEVAKSLEAVGGDLNAYTTREYTCFHATALREHAEIAVDVLCDLVSQAKFNQKDFERERQVILQELAMTVDTPEEYVFDLFFSEVFGKNQLGWPILGTEDSLTSMKRSDLFKYYRSRYVPQNMIVSAAGAVDHNHMVQLIKKKLGSKKKAPAKGRIQKPQFVPFKKWIPAQSEQCHVLVGIPMPSFKNSERFDAFIINALLGGGMTSKLYQSIRERRGLAYSVYSQLTTFMDTGLCIVYAATDLKSVKEVCARIFEEINRLRTQALRKSDLHLFKQQVRGSILLGSDDIENRMTSLGVNEMVFGEYRSVERVIGEIDRVSMESVQACIDKWLSPDKFSIFIYGPEPKGADGILGGN